MQWQTPRVAITENMLMPIHNNNSIIVNISYFFSLCCSFCVYCSFGFVTLFHIIVGTIMIADMTVIASISWPVPCPYLPNA